MAIDNKKSIHEFIFHPNSGQRIKSFNYYVSKILQKECHDDDRYLVFVGSAHAYKIAHTKSIKELSKGAISIVVVDEENKYTQFPHLIFNYKEKRYTKRDIYELSSDLLIKYD